MDTKEKFEKYTYYFLICLIFALGIFLRIKLFIDSSAFEDDECRLAFAMLDKNIWQMFLPLGYAQSAPPIFLFFSKIIANISGYAEKALWLIPLSAGIASIFYFFKLLAAYFKNRLVILIGLYSFVVNTQLVAFSCTFKQYSTDVLVTIMCLYYLNKIDISNLSNKKFITLSIVLIILPLISLPSLFFIGGFLLINLIKYFRNKPIMRKIIYVVLPFTIALSVYYIFNLAPSKMDLDLSFPNYWKTGLMGFLPKDIFTCVITNIKYYFSPNSLTFFTLSLYVWGIFICIFDKGETKDISRFLVVSTLFVFLASMLKLYPWEARVGLYYLSIFTILMLKPFDSYNIRKPAFYLALIFVFLSLYKYDFKHISRLNETELVGYSPKYLMLVLKEKFNPKTDAVLCNPASTASYMFYSSKFSFDTEEVYEMETRPAERDVVLGYLNSLKKDQRFWLYLIKDYKKNQIFPYIQEWLNTLSPEQILYSKRDKDSSLIYIQN